MAELQSKHSRNTFETLRQTMESTPIYEIARHDLSKKINSEWLWHGVLQVLKMVAGDEET